MDPLVFTEEIMEDYLLRLDMEARKTETITKMPSSLDPSKWTPWRKEVANYLGSIKGVNNTPLTYIIRKDLPPITFASPAERYLYAVVLSGPEFEEDNAKVFNFLAMQVSKTEAAPWLVPFEKAEDGRGAWRSLCQQYEGVHERKTKIAVACRTLEETWYQSEKRFTWNRYVTKLTEAFDTLAELGHARPEEEKVKILLKYMQVDNPRLLASMAHVEHTDSLSEDFRLACATIGSAIASLGPTTSSGRPSARNVSATGTGRGGGGRGRGRGGGGRSGRGGGRGGGRGRGGRGNNNSTQGSRMNNGVDVTNLNRNFEGWEWRQLDQSVRDEIKQARAQSKNTSKRQIASTDSTGGQGLQEENDDTPTHHANAFGLPGYQNKRPKTQGDDRRVSKIKSGKRYISSVTRSHEPQTVPNTIGTLEMDNHADTCCFGPNFTPICFTEHTCDVTPYTDAYDSMNVTVASAATAYDNPITGETTILVFHQGLWFGNKLSHSLVNPHQCRLFGLEICDDACDPHRSLGIRDSDGRQIMPLEFQNSIVLTTTRAPTREELNDQSLRHIVMTSNAIWDPVTTGNHPPSPEEEARRRLIADVDLTSYSTADYGRTLVDRMMSAVKVASTIETTEEIPYTGRDCCVHAVHLQERHSRVTVLGYPWR